MTNEAQRAMPNVLIITCHDLGNYLGCYGARTVRTPNLDRLAAEGVRFSRAFCSAPQCSPSRASIFTGRYPHSNGVMGLTHAEFAWDLHPDERHLGQILREQGYRTVMLGIHHESRAEEHEKVARRCGMDEVVPPMHGEVLTDAAIERLERFAGGDRPFYLQIGYHEPHRAAPEGETYPDWMGFAGGYIEPDDELGIDIPGWILDEPGARDELAELQGAIRYVDAAIGRLLDGLERLSLAENTLIVMTTDHGLALPRAKCTLYDPGIETALIMRLPSRGWSGGQVIDDLVSNVDLFPTVLDLLGLPVSERVQGRSLLPLVTGAEPSSRDAIYAELTYHDYYDPQRAIRTERHKLIVYFTVAPSFMDPSQSWRSRTRPVRPENPATSYHVPVALYDLDADPLEFDNRADDLAYASIRRDLLRRLYDWMHSTNDPLLHGAITSPTHHEAIAHLRGDAPV